MQLHELKPKTGRLTSKRIGRGRASGKGKTAGRGTKGQKARAGHRIWPNVREQLKKIPKRRGYNNQSIQREVHPVNVSTLEKFFNAGDAINPKTLAERGVVRSYRGELPRVKILGDGALSKKFAISGCKVSASAKEKIEKVGGSIA